MRVRRRLAAVVIPLVAVAALALTAVWTTEHDARHGSSALLHTYDFDSAGLQRGFGAYDSRSETGLDSVSPRMVSQRDGKLVLSARGSVGSGVCLCGKGDKPTKPYGRWVIRARASGGDADHGFAMLLWPNAEDWPVGGEIDLMELPNADRSRLQTSVHYSASNRQFTHFTAGDFTAWHEYGVTWTSSLVSFDVDGRVVFQVTSPRAIPHRPMHLAMQAGRNPSVRKPGNTRSTLTVDWVKTYALPPV